MLPIDLLTGTVSTIDALKTQNGLLAANLGYVLDESFINAMNEKINEMIKYSYQAPMIYANNLLGMSYYMLDYTREVNEQSGKNYFDYYNIKNLDEIEANIEDKKGNKKKVPIEFNPLDKIKNRLNDVDNEINKLKKEEEIKENTQRNLENPKNKNPKKQAIIEAINEWMQNYPEKETELLEKKSNIKKELEDEKTKSVYSVELTSKQLEKILQGFKL